MMVWFFFFKVLTVTPARTTMAVNKQLDFSDN